MSDKKKGKTFGVKFNTGGTRLAAPPSVVATTGSSVPSAFSKAGYTVATTKGLEGYFGGTNGKKKSTKKKKSK